MRNLTLAACLVAVGYGGWRWKHGADTDTRARNLAVNRFWVDHMPANERDPFKVFVVSTPEGLGGFAEETQWRGQIERFRFDIDGNVIHAVFPWSGTREDITVNARPCDEQGMDYCLELSGSSHGVTHYYSLTGWERKPAEDLDALVPRVLARP
ncbi:MAG TPA: hypothetical protein VMJ10_27200 [Kofleriaceae bacterium]|nr:hypothetical protein [Kofleriaceae bacterium]